MQTSMWGYLLLALGIIGIMLINMFGNISTTNEQNYYLLREVTEASMYDAIDFVAYRLGVNYDGNNTGVLRIEKEKFVESFVRRFAETAGRNKDYVIIFQEIIETPPKVSVVVRSNEPYSFFDRFTPMDKKIEFKEDSFNIQNRIDAILEDCPNEECKSYDSIRN
ncbi:MAG: DUF5411 family protein [Bacilli bacterium]